MARGKLRIHLGAAPGVGKTYACSPNRGGAFTEMDIDAVLRRAPAVALVDELAHTNAPGSRNASAGGTWRNCSPPAST